MPSIFPKKTLTIAVVLFIIQFFFSSFVLAAGSDIQFKPQISIPGFEGGPIGNTTAKIGEYIKALYIFLISALAILSVVMIAWAGITWLTAGGSSEKVSTAKARILAALGGLALGLVSYVILQTINPALVNFKISSIAPVDPLYMQNVTAKEICPLTLKDKFNNPIRCGEKYSTATPDITGDKSKEIIEGCMGVSCYEAVDILENFACQLFKDSNGNYVSGGCLKDNTKDPATRPLKDNRGRVSEKYFGSLSSGVGKECGLAYKEFISGNFWLGTRCDLFYTPNSRTCVLESDSFVLNVDEITSTTGLLSPVPINNMSCKP